MHAAATILPALARCIMMIVLLSKLGAYGGETLHIVFCHAQYVTVGEMLAMGGGVNVCRVSMAFQESWGGWSDSALLSRLGSTQSTDESLTSAHIDCHGPNNVVQVDDHTLYKLTNGYASGPRVSHLM